MEKLVVGVSCEAIFNITNQELSWNDNSQQGSEPSILVKGPMLDFVKRLSLLTDHQSDFCVEIVIVSDLSPYLASSLFDSLEYYQLLVSQVILTGGRSISDYLKALEIDLYFSSYTHLIRSAQSVGILAGMVPKRRGVKDYRFAFDHRLFSDDEGYLALGKLLPLLGFFQRHKQGVRVGIITTRYYSLETWVKDLFKSAECRIDEICFLGCGGQDEVFRLFNFMIYFEGMKRDDILGAPPAPCLLNIDF